MYFFEKINKYISKIKVVNPEETRNSANEYLKVMKSVPAFASILDSLDDMSISNMNNEIKEVINGYGGYVSSFLNFSLYITKKSAKR